MDGQTQSSSSSHAVKREEREGREGGYSEEREGPQEGDVFILFSS